jgi:hypothetical protein
MSDVGSPIDSGRLLQTLGAYADNGPDVVQAKLVNDTSFDTSQRSGRLALFDADGVPLRTSEAVVPSLIPTGMYTSYPEGGYTTAAFGAINTLHLTKVWLPPGTITEISGEVTTVAAAGGTIRLGVYYHNPATGLPGNLLVESGALNSVTSTGLKAATVSGVVPKAGWYWIGGVAQGQVCTMRMSSGANSNLPKFSSGQSAIAALSVTGISGALPNSPAVTTNVTNCPIIHLKWG